MSDRAPMPGSEFREMYIRARAAFVAIRDDDTVPTRVFSDALDALAHSTGGDQWEVVELALRSGMPEWFTLLPMAIARGLIVPEAEPAAVPTGGAV